MIAWQVRIREGKLDREGERTVALNMYQLMYGLQAANIERLQQSDKRCALSKMRGSPMPNRMIEAGSEAMINSNGYW